MIYRILIVVGILLLIDLFVFQGVRTLTRDLSPRARIIVHSIYWLISFSVFAAVIIGVLKFNRNTGPTHYFSKVFAFFLVFFLPKLLFAVILLLEDFFRLFHFLFDAIASNKGNKVTFDDRRKFISQFALFIAAIPFAGVLHGVTRGKYKFTVHRVELEFPDLPESFDGFTITQISDVHSGSLEDEEQIARGVEMINAQKSELFLFTGDLVNNKASEMDRFIELFKSIEAPMGKFSILGNHDYGGYINWKTPIEKQQNDERLLEVHKQIGFDLLRNEHRKITKGTDSINLVGVHNWGLPPFPQLGDLDIATKGMDKGFNVLMSHDPSHWRAQVLRHQTNFHLTLSGHTHGMQFGIEIDGIKWSPVKYKYPEWAGLYSEGKKHLYVNRGFGYIGFPGRVGIWPEITVITLKRST